MTGRSLNEVVVDDGCRHRRAVLVRCLAGAAVTGPVRSLGGPTAMADSYIVVLKDSAAPVAGPARSLAAGHGGAAVAGTGTDDCNGHGTHVAGTLGGASYGVAKGVTLVPVRVLDCSGNGTFAALIAGVD